jgi:predicted nucleotidyltransferase
MGKQITHEYLVENGLILFETIVGSQAYGTQTPTSDIDKKFVYILPMDNILGTSYMEQINVNKDYTGWEIRRFLELMGSNNPTVLELLNSPEDCIISKHPLFDLILEQKEAFITKICKDSFGGYARQQIKKAKGLNKKQNWEKDKVVRKDLLDFCYVLQGEKSIPWRSWNQSKYDEKFIGAVNIPNARDTYALFYDSVAEMLHSQNTDEELRESYKEALRKAGKAMGMGYKGLINTGHEDEDGKVNYGISNQLRLSSVPKGEKVIATIVYNKDGYSEHCKDYKEYQEWLENRNEARYVETQEHGQRIDGKINYGISNQLRLSSVPKGEKVIATIVYNKDGYSEHCKDYKEYQEWLENRNEARYVETQEHGQGIDGKNMMHCMRLIQMSKEIGRGEGIIVRRPDAQELLKIRRGEVDLETLIELADKEIAEMDEIFDNCNLPNKVDKDLVNKLLVQIRTEFYKPKKWYKIWPFYS